jgi:hypothetical protein
MNNNKFFEAIPGHLKSSEVISTAHLRSSPSTHCIKDNLDKGISESPLHPRCTGQIWIGKSIKQALRHHQPT